MQFSKKKKKMILMLSFKDPKEWCNNICCKALQLEAVLYNQFRFYGTLPQLYSYSAADPSAGQAKLKPCKTSWSWKSSRLIGTTPCSGMAFI